MKKHLTATSLLWISFTSMIGSGWLFGALYSAHFAGPAAVIAWPLAGFLLLFVALAYAEVATMFPQTNSLAQLPIYTHGHLTSVLINGLTWLSLATIPAIETQGIIQYASNYLPHVMAHEGLRYIITPRGYFLALILLISFVILNYFGMCLFARINASFTLWKLLIPSITAIALLSTSYHANNFSQYGGFMPYGWQGVMAAMSSGGVLFSLLGFRQAIIMVGETKKPGKYIPIVLISSLMLTALLYTVLQWSFIGSLRAQDLTHGWANLTFAGDAGPFAALTTFAGLTYLSMLLYSDAFISPYSTALVYSMTAARMLSSLGATKVAPQSLATENKYHVPWISLCINCLLAATIFFLLRDWQAMAAFLVTALMMSYAIGPICLVCLRKQLPTHHRPFRLWCGEIIAFIGFYICTAGVYWAGLQSIFKLLMLTVIGLVIYLLYCYFKKLQRTLDGKHSLWLICYFLGLCIFSYFGNYGGKGVIPPYYDLLYLLAFSFIIFSLAFFSKKPSIHTERCVQAINQ